MITLVKIGGSLITDKQTEQSFRSDVMSALARQIAQVMTRTEKQMIVGHGSGSFGHAAASRHNTLTGVHTPLQWSGFTEVAFAAASLNQLVMTQLIEAGLPALRFQPSATLQAHDGQITDMAITTLIEALDHGLLPVVYGDVAFDRVRGGTIASTESIFTYLVAHLPVSEIILLGEVEGVLDENNRVIPHLTPANIAQHQHVLGGSRGTDVTGGMLTKVTDMLALAEQNPALQIHIMNGLHKNSLVDALLDNRWHGTLITA